MEYVILHNRHDKISRKIVEENQGKYKVIDWLNEAERDEYILSGKPSPTIFPCLVDIENNILVSATFSIEKGLEEIRRIKRGVDPYQIERFYQYINNGLNAESWIIAFLQKELDDDHTEWNRMVSLRQQIKQKVPKDINERLSRK